MTDKEKIIAEIERLTEVTGYALSEYENGRRSAMYDIRKQLIEYINTLPAEQQSSSLDTFIQSLLETYPTNKNEVPKEALNDYHQGLICGARKTYNWILESAIDGCYIKRNKYNKENVLNGLSVTCDAIQKFKDGDKVKVIIVKEDKQ